MSQDSLVQSVDNNLTKLFAVQREKNGRVKAIVEERDTEKLISMFQDLHASLQDCIENGKKVAHTASLVLYELRKIWDDLPTDFTSQWNYRFDQYAEETTGLAYSTIINSITTAEVFLSGDTELPDKPKDFDPFRINPSLLVLSAHAARTGKLGEDGWSALSNPKTKWAEMRATLHKGKELTEGEDKKPIKEPQKQFFSQAGVILYKEDGKIVPIATMAGIQEVNPDDIYYLNRGQNELRNILKVKEYNAGVY